MSGGFREALEQGLKEEVEFVSGTYNLRVSSEDAEVIARHLILDSQFMLDIDNEIYSLIGYLG